MHLVDLQAVGALPDESDVLNVPPADSVVWDVPPARQYDLIADLLDTDMLKLYSDILSQEKQCMQKGMTTKFG